MSRNKIEDPSSIGVRTVYEWIILLLIVNMYCIST